ncbi:MAG: hypothetical protein GY705_20845 [Bacteroidetes bacterium]|nr:hypothetical protein [Bacteroidota bacterium]
MLIVYLSYFIERENFLQLIIPITLLFGIYIFLFRDYKNRQWKKSDYFWMLLPRLVLLISIPAFSDDVYRFIWDGRLLINGFNPILYLPNEIISTDIAQSANLTSELTTQLNSLQRENYTCYPPVLQFIFGGSALFSFKNLFFNIVLLRLVIILAEVFTVFYATKILKRLKKTTGWAALYAFNPLIVIELTGNLHFEAVQIAFLVVALWFLLNNKWIHASIGWALAASVKLIPLLFIPLVMKYLGWKKGIYFSGICGAIFILLFVPFFSIESLVNFLSSINLYFQKFEFNASLYYIARFLGYKYSGYNLIAYIGPGLSVVTVLAVGVLSLLLPKHQFIPLMKSMSLALLVYLLLATTIHPWYISTLVMLSIFTRFYFPIVWSFTAFFSYAAYHTAYVEENFLLLTFEYLAVFTALYFDLNKLKNNIKWKPITSRKTLRSLVK